MGPFTIRYGWKEVQLLLEYFLLIDSGSGDIAPFKHVFE